ncbi:hypothetical protein FI667_g1196, partial [Globisporangium splendens]
MSAFVREWYEEPSGVSTAAAARQKKVPPALKPEDDHTDDDDEVDETFLALQKLLMNMEGRRLSQVAPAASATVPNATTMSTTPPPPPLHPQQQRRASQEEILESRRREREQFRHLLFTKSSTAGDNAATNDPSRCPTAEDDDDEEEEAPSVESTITNRMMNGSFSSSFSRYSVHAISRERWAKEETERLPLVLLPKDGKVSSPADNPKLNVTHTAEYIDLSEQMEAKLKDVPKDKDHVCLTPPRSTWTIQMRDFDALNG